MDSGWLQPLHYLWQACTKERSPRQLALGIALGMVIGLVPKGNLTATVLAMVLALLKLNLGAALLSALVFSYLSPLGDPLFHAVGWRLLSAPALRGTWENLHRQPFVPWLSINNTVVMGTLVVGWALFYPCYRVTLGIVLRLQPLAARLRPAWRPWHHGESRSADGASAGLFRVIRPASHPAGTGVKPQEGSDRTEQREAA
jgi:uncharacterized protein (TIGR03546 family)